MSPPGSAQFALPAQFVIPERTRWLSLLLLTISCFVGLTRGQGSDRTYDIGSSSYPQHGHVFPGEAVSDAPLIAMHCPTQEVAAHDPHAQSQICMIPTPRAPVLREEGVITQISFSSFFANAMRQLQAREVPPYHVFERNSVITLQSLEVGRIGVIRMEWNPHAWNQVFFSVQINTAEFLWRWNARRATELTSFDIRFTLSMTQESGQRYSNTFRGHGLTPWPLRPIGDSDHEPEVRASQQHIPPLRNFGEWRYRRMGSLRPGLGVSDRFLIFDLSTLRQSDSAMLSQQRVSSLQLNWAITAQERGDVYIRRKRLYKYKDFNRAGPREHSPGEPGSPAEI